MHSHVSLFLRNSIARRLSLPANQSNMKKPELVFIPFPGVGHLGSTVEVAKRFVNRNNRLCITILIMKLPSDSNNTFHSADSVSSTDSIRHHHLPRLSVEPDISPISYVEDQKVHVKDAVAELISSDPSRHLAGFVVDMFCTSMIDVANEFGVPSYVFYTSNATFLSLNLHLQALRDAGVLDTTELQGLEDMELAVPSFSRPFPAKCLPTAVLDKKWAEILVGLARRFRETKGIMVNTFLELESYALDSLSTAEGVPPVFPVGPILNLNSAPNLRSESSDIMRWLDVQPPSSVVFLCFGSMGSFGSDQVKEIANALEKSEVRFLWSLRQPPPNFGEPPSNYSDPKAVLPDGFLERTAELGKVIGWAPQVEVLAHKAVGGFISHCGWNSTLESIWNGVVIGTWPLYAEQQTNAFTLVKELEMAVEIKMDYRNDLMFNNPETVSGAVIERAIREVMGLNGDESAAAKRKKVKEVGEKSRKALMEGGSSLQAMDCFIDLVLQNCGRQLLE